MKKLTMRNYLGYAAGDLANNLAFSLQALFLLIYYTNVVGLNPAPIATMFLVVRAWDAFADLAAGRLVDLTHSRWGKFRPYLLFASLPLLLSSVALFSVPNFDSTTAKYIYAYITYALLGFLYSLTNIPYGSLATAMTQDPVERSRLGIWRTVGPIVGTFVLVLVIAPSITRYKTQPEELQAFLTTVTIVFAVVGYALYLFCFSSCKEQVFHDSKPVTVKETVATVRQNRPLLILCMSNLIFLTGVFGLQASQAYYAAYILGNSTQLIWMVLATSLATFVAVPVVPSFVARIGKKNTFLIGAAGSHRDGRLDFLHAGEPAHCHCVVLRLRPLPEPLNVLTLRFRGRRGRVRRIQDRQAHRGRHVRHLFLLPEGFTSGRRRGRGLCARIRRLRCQSA
jgi:glucuronide carrier protein